MNHFHFHFLFLILIPTFFVISDIAARSQDVGEIRDTLRSARIVADRRATRDAGTRIVALPELRGMVSATGEADVVKYIQTMPGVSTGAEGSSAIYVRGGNLGSNLTTLDGVALYGGSHLLGLASAYPTDIVSEASFRMGGFRGDESNLTASHIDLRTVDGSFTNASCNVSASTLLLGATVSMPLVRDKVSLAASLRVSPLGPAFRAVQAITGGVLDSLSRTQAIVYDAFAKANWRINSDNSLSLSIFQSLDRYSYRYGGYSDEGMGWDNLIVNARHEGRLGNNWSVEDGFAYNRFTGRQGIVRAMHGTQNSLAILSSVNEWTADVVFARALPRKGDVRLGARTRFTLFNPGTSSTFKGGGPLLPLDSPMTDHSSHAWISTLHAQWDMQLWNRLDLMASIRLNVYGADESGNPAWQWRINPEAGLLARFAISPWLSMEATADWTVQYYHTLEGIPLGWSVDLLVPTSPACPPEQARQFYAGLFASFGQHRFTVGAYDKRMGHIVYFADASKLFSPAIAGWSNNIEVGSGTSRGIELLYELDGERFDCRVAYTLSKTDRTFEQVNGGRTFPAKFDRRHIFNATASFVLKDDERRSIALTGLFTFQSGHRETVAAAEYPSVTLWGEGGMLDYFSSVNNYKMPDYIRLDLGCRFLFKTRRPQELNVGVYNVMNRHNPFSVIYDNRSREWKQVSLLPIMPSFNYRIAF